LCGLLVSFIYTKTVRDTFKSLSERVVLWEFEARNCFWFLRMEEWGKTKGGDWIEQIGAGTGNVTGDFDWRSLGVECSLWSWVERWLWD
jgi:hypothetical protein